MGKPARLREGSLAQQGPHHKNFQKEKRPPQGRRFCCWNGPALPAHQMTLCSIHLPLTKR